MPESLRAKVEAFLGTPGKCEGDTAPAITQHYRNTFNGTDQFDCYLGHIPYNVRVANIHHLCLISSLRMSLVNAYTLSCTVKGLIVDDKPEGIKAFVKEVEENLL